MIWDKCKKMAHSELQFWRDYEFGYDDFIRKIPGNPTRRWQRIPVENDVEYLFIEGLYYTWKACGDDEWMTGLLDNALAAVRYATSDPYRWSEKYKLLKRGYTIDTWDVQHAEDAARSGTPMRVLLDKTIFGVMYGDNTGMAVSCRYLAEMLRVAGRDAEATDMEALADNIKQRLDALAWNGRFYTHHISEHPEIKRDVGSTDENAQVTQSNAYSLNRRIDHEQCVEIIKTYQRIRDEMPATSSGEFYLCYPPFEKGFKSLWDYMNGGVTTICAGELAHGAFEHGYETYAVDILQRLMDWSRRLGGYLHCCLKGKLPDPIPATFRPVDMRSAANVDTCGEGGGRAVIGWLGEGDNDMRNLPVGTQSFEGIQFDLIDPAANNRCAFLGISSKSPYTRQSTVPVNAKAKSVYFLHTVNQAGKPAGSITVRYSDGSHVVQYVNRDSEVLGWFMPAPNNPYAGGNQRKKPGNLRMAWQGPNGKFENVGVCVYGWNNPRPDLEISEIEFTAAETLATWLVGGITLSDQPVQFPASPISHGIPDMWGSAALVYALLEGLAGVVDTGKAFDRARVSPRWPAAGVGRATACVKYPASGGYVRYKYEGHGTTVQALVTGNADNIELEFLLPHGADVASTTVNGVDVDATIKTVETSRYAVVPLQGVGVHDVWVRTT